MVTKNPIFAKWSFKRFQATVINDIWPETLFFSLVALMVTLVNKFTDTGLTVNNQMLNVLGTVLGLVISFRTSSAYERFMEGRKLWTNINLTSRNLGHLIWIHVPNDRKVKNPENAAQETAEQARLKSVIEKKSMINLLEGFSVAVKHALRGEAGIYYEDLYPLVCFLPRFATKAPLIDIKTDVLPLWQASQLDDPKNHASAESTLKGLSRTTSNPSDMNEKDAAISMVRGKKSRKRHSDPEHILPVFDCDRQLKPARNPPKTSLYDFIPLLIIFKPIIWIFKYMYRKVRRDKYASARPEKEGIRNAFGRKRKVEMVESSVPLEITLFLSSYLAWLMKNEYISNVMASPFSAAIISLQDTMANLDRISSTPIPFAYQAHLRISLWLYLFFLPFETYDNFGWLTIGATAFASFLLLGFLEIGQEIEDPFGYDANDLDLDEFCACIHRELAEITAHTSPEPNSFLFESWNHPFAPGDNRSAKDMIENVEHAYHGPDTGMLSIRRTLLDSWRSSVKMHKKS
ncbi:UPF0187-domain-containing protein [Fomitiporia mediterranea MF3/22]|uniref:UPF0187-domain-containing protein n=1 Tax=Fomitiporia mediterranea (strain MF3/22) TaxID=694068 RepID=UPI000440775C|nr:UPF0187-domain-containing protein [Fomitiporia mediterranea MF3/22]EJD02783.1 UPF0187-domain-containing protein [Fomitiporia mediterranea MF3/22]